MSRKQPKGKSTAFTVFHVEYEDGRVTSNRRVPNELLDQSFGDTVEAMARAAIKAQDDEISRRSGQSRANIKSIARA